ncbi:MAG TPA: chromosome segregation protein SMC, partial [Candidatus Deferrimicrobium sp.]|nr:chromosome segregation protein SMC [Candidatus Deferrimicrobium sp.]
MYLKQLDVLGFKSFANKVSVHFSNGVTAIVGPNGCGKTNILDAVRWVLGEQKVSLLRGSKMEEVIFNGTRDVKPLGMAEVTMLLENNRGTLPTEYHEVQITRRLFRSGESEYLLNKVPCRLKDIAELFYDTGMGAHSYSVIQQEMIDAVISDRAEERRFLFEEAAGITKYKQRKKAALRKLEATDNDFLRLNDIYAEVKSQVLSLKRQHRKAERYQAIADDIRAWELFLSSQRRRTIESEQHDLRARLQAQSDRRLEHVAAVDRLAAQVESDRKEQVGLDAELVSVGGQVYQLSEQAHSDEREISVLAEKRANARGLIERNESEIEVLQARRGALHEQSAASERDLEQCRHDLDQVALGLREAEAELADADQRLLAARSAKELEGRSLIDLEGKLSSGRTETEGLRQQEEELTRLRTELEQQISEKTAARERLQAEAEAARQAVTEISERKAAAESSCQTLNTRIEQLLAQAENLTLEVSNLTASIEACEARRKLLEDMIVHYEGYESGVIAAMDERDRFGGGLVGTVAEKFVPAEGYEAVVDAALGEMAGFVICRDRDTAEAVIACVKSEKTGKIGILVPDSGTLNPVIKRPDLQLPEFVGWLDEFVTTEPELRPLLEAVLAWTAVFKSEYSPQPLLELLPYGFKAVSTAGVVYGKNVIAGGSDDRFPLFRRQEKVTQQQQMIDELGERLASAKHQKSMVTADIAAARAESATLTQTLESLAEELQTQQTKLNELEFQCRSLDGDLERLRRERQSSQAKLDKIRSRQYSLGLDVSQISSQREDLTQRMSRLGDSLANAEEAATRCLERVSQLQVAAVEARSKVEQSETKLTHLRELSDELNRTIAAKQEEISVALREIGDADRTISETEERLKAIFAQRAEVTTRQSRLRTVQAELLERMAARENELKEARHKKDTVNDEVHQLEIRLNTLESEIRSLGERVRDEFDVDLAATEPVAPDDKLSEDDARAHLSEQKEALKQ